MLPREPVQSRVPIVCRHPAKVRLKLWHFNGIHRLGVLAQHGVLFGVLAQVTELESTFLLAKVSKSLLWNWFWSHPPGSNRRPADYEEYSLAPNSPLILYGCA